MRIHGCGPRGYAYGPMAAMLMTGWGRGWGGHWGSDWNGEGRGGPGRRGPGGRGRMFGSGELRLVLLGLVAETPRHGYELIKAIEELSGGNYAPSPGVVYPTLSLLTDEGLVAELASSGARKSFEVTDAGRKELDDRVDEFKAIIDRLGSLGEADRAHPILQLQRAMDNVRGALRMHRHRGPISQETAEQIVDLLDEAARKIERL